MELNNLGPLFGVVVKFVLISIRSSSLSTIDWWIERLIGEIIEPINISSPSVTFVHFMAMRCKMGRTGRDGGHKVR